MSPLPTLLLRFLRDDYVQDLQVALAAFPEHQAVVRHAVVTVDDGALYDLDLPRDLYRPLVQLQTLATLAERQGDHSIWPHVQERLAEPLPIAPFRRTAAGASEQLILIADATQPA